MKNKKLSVIIPIYNAEKYIEICLDSLKSLLSNELEILAINDGSTDNSTKILNDCVSKDSRIRHINVPNGGVSKARNIGIANATGKYIMFLDADDYLLKDALNLISDAIDSEKYDFMAFSRQIIEEGRVPWNDKFFFSEPETSDKNIIDSIMFADSHFNECWGKLYKKELIDKYKIEFPEGVPIGEDMMFVMEYYSHCETVFASNFPLVAYRQHGESAMRKYGIDDRLRFSRKLFEFTKSYVPSKLDTDFWYYNFKIITNLCREYSRQEIATKTIKTIYSSDFTNEVVKHLKSSLIPKYRLHEYFLMRNKLYLLSAVYYNLKSLRN